MTIRNSPATPLQLLTRQDTAPTDRGIHVRQQVLLLVTMTDGKVDIVETQDGGFHTRMTLVVRRRSGGFGVLHGLGVVTRCFGITLHHVFDSFVCFYFSLIDRLLRSRLFIL